MLATGQVVIPSGGTVLCVVPPGPCDVVISNLGTATIYVGAGATVAATSGAPVPSGGILPFNGYQGSPGAILRAVTAAGSATAGFLISTSYGLPQPGSQ
jgi:hypothetical protein